MKSLFTALATLLLAICPNANSQTFDLNAWKAQYGTPYSTTEFLNAHPFGWSDYYDSASVDCAKNFWLFLGPIGVRAYPFDQAVNTSAFASIYPSELVDAQGLIQNCWGVIDTQAGSPADGILFPGDVILTLQNQLIKTADNVTLPHPLLQKSSRGIELHTGQLIDQAEGTGTLQMKVLRAATTLTTSAAIATGTTSAEITVNLSNQAFVRLFANAPNACLSNWINPRLVDALGNEIPLSTQTIVNKSGFLTPVIGKDANNAAVIDGTTTITNCIGVKGNSLIEFAIPSGYTALKFKLQATGTTGISSKAIIMARTSARATTPYNPRQYDVNGFPILPPELASATQSINLTIPQLGSFGDTFDPTGSKATNYASTLAARLASEQNANGSWSGNGGTTQYWPTSMAALALMSTGDPSYLPNIQKAAQWVTANISTTNTGWSFPNGYRLLFLSEYYLRYKDASVLPALQYAVDYAQGLVHNDAVWGHGLNPGYGGAGFIGATGSVTAGLALASYTPVNVDRKLLKKSLLRIEELAGTTGGQLPYTRDASRDAFNGIASTTQSYSANSLVALATKIGGGTPYMVELFRNRYGNAPAYGDVDNGHATNTLSFVNGSMAIGIWGDQGHIRNMTAYLFRMTLKRDFSGWINQNLSKLELHTADGSIGTPTFDTAGYLILFNIHKRNLAITGKPEFQATTLLNTEKRYDPDRALLTHVQSNWNMIEAALGSKFPPALRPALNEIRSYDRGLDLRDRIFAFLQREGPNAARTILSIPNLDPTDQAFYAEMLLGVGHEMTLLDTATTPSTTGSSTYKFSLNAFLPNRWTNGTNPCPINGTVTISDASQTYLTSPITLNFSDSTLNPTTTFTLPTASQVNLTATFNYTISGVRVNYAYPLIANLEHAFITDSRAGNFTNFRKIWVPANCPNPFHNWNMPVTLPSGEPLPGASKCEGGIGFYTYDNGTLVTADDAYKARIAGKPAGYWCCSGDRFGEVPILGVNLLPSPTLSTNTISQITATTATTGGTITSDGSWPITERGICWSTTNLPTILHSKISDTSSNTTGTFTLGLTSLLPGTTYYVRAYAINAYGTTYGNPLAFTTSGGSGTWTSLTNASWDTSTSWLNGTIPNGIASTANFTTVTPNADTTVSIPSTVTLGALSFGSPSFTKTWILSPSTATATLDLNESSTSAPNITVATGSTAINLPISGHCGLTVTGPGNLALNAINTFGGDCVVTSGTLTLNGSLTEASPLTINTGATLAGTGTIHATATIQGTITPNANAIGSLTIEKSLTLSGSANVQVNASSAASDVMISNTSITCGGSLTVTNLAGTFTAGQSFQILQAPRIQGSFASLSLPTLPAGLQWITANLYSTGTLIVGTPVAITAQPTAKTLAINANGTFSVTATGSPTPTYQWQNSPTGTTWTNIADATLPTLTVTGATALNNYLYRCVITNPINSVTSNTAKLTVSSSKLPTFTAQPKNLVQAAVGTNATFSVTVTGSPTPTLQWQISDDQGTTWTNFTGKTTNSLTFASTTADASRLFRCAATNSVGTAYSSPAILVVSATPIWINSNGGSWNTAANWSNNTVLSGTDLTADFSKIPLTTSPTVTLASNPTAGNLIFGSSNQAGDWTINPSTGTTLTLAHTTATPTITVLNGTATINATIAGTNGLTKTGPGTLALTATNTYTGNTSVTQGTLTITQASCLSSGNLTLGSSTLSNANSSAITLNNPLSLSGTLNLAGNQGWFLTGATTLTSATTLNTLTATTLSGAITGTFGITKTGSAPLTLNANTPSGAITINEGDLILETYGSSGYNASATTLNNGSSLTFRNGTNGYIVWIGNKTITFGNAGGSTLTCHNTNFAFSGTNTFTTTGGATNHIGGFNLNGNTATLNVAQGSATTALAIDQNIWNNGNLVKNGSGRLDINVVNTYGGTTTITDGEVFLNNGSTGAGHTTIQANGTLSGTGSTGTLSCSGALKPGTSTDTGKITVNGSLTLNPSAKTTIKLAKTSTSTSNDQIICSSSMAFGGTLTITHSGTAIAQGDSFQIFQATSFSGAMTLVLPTLSNGLTWDTSQLYSSGIIRTGLKSQTITLGSTPSSILVGSSTPLTASASSGLTLDFASSNPNVALVQFGNQLTAVGLGTTTITATQSGNGFYAAAPPVSFQVTVTGTLPSVLTVQPSVVMPSYSTLLTGGTQVTSPYQSVTSRGVCWATHTNPSTTDNVVTQGSGTGSYSCTLTNLPENQTIYLRAFATNATGTGYGAEFTYLNSIKANSHWKMDETTGQTRTDSEAGYNATLVGCSTVAGKINNGLAFGGTNADYGTIPAAALSNTTNEVSIAFWGKPNNTTQTSVLLFAGNANNERVMCIHFPWSNTIYWDAGNTTTSYDRIQKSVTAAELTSDWAHWVFTKNANTGNMKIYRNGVLWHSGTGKTRKLEAISNLYLGYEGPGKGGYYNGNIDELKFWNRELTAEEVTRLALAPTSNLAPVFTTTPITLTNATEKSAYSQSIASKASDPNPSDTITFSKLNGPDWLTVSANGTCSGTPPAGTAGVNQFAIRATDSLNASTDTTLVITVNNAPDTPIFTNAPFAFTAAENLPFSTKILTHDADTSDTLSVSATSLPSWLTLTNDGSLSGLPKNQHVGTTAFSITVTDSTGRSSTAAASITVNNLNQAPSFAQNPLNIRATQNLTLNTPILATDIDAGDTLTYSATNLPAWLNYSSNGTLTGTPSNNEVGTHSWIVTATDSQGLSTSATVILTVDNVNDAPTMANVSRPLNPYASIGSSVATMIVADIDPNDSHTFAIINGNTNTAFTINPNTGEVTVAKTLSLATTQYTLTIRATDVAGASTTATLTLTLDTTSTHWIVDNNGSWLTTSNWSNNTLPANSANTSVNFSTVNLSANRTVTLDSAVTLNRLIFGDSNPSHTWTINPGTSGSLTLAGTSPTIDVYNQTTTIATPLLGSAGFTKIGSGQLTVSNTGNSITGNVSVNAGTLVMNSTSGQILPTSSTLTVNAGATLKVTGSVNIYQRSGTNAPLILNGGTFDYQANTHGHMGPITLLNGGSWQASTGGGYNGENMQLNGTVTVTTGTSHVPSTISNFSQGVGLSGNIRFAIDDATADPNPDLIVSAELENNDSSNSGLIKSGTGTMSLTYANTYSNSTTIEAGTIEANNTTGSATGTSPITIQTAGTLSGTGSVSGAITHNGTIAPGTSSSIGTLTAGSVTTNAQAKFAFKFKDLSGTAGAGFDSLNLNSLNLTNATSLTVAISDELLNNLTSSAKSYPIITTTAGITGFNPSAVTLNQSKITTLKGTWSIAQAGNNLVLNYTPSPYEAWKQTNTIPLSPSADQADPDQDGIPNLVEYALNLNPNSPSSLQSAITASLISNNQNKYLQIAVKKNPNATDISYAAEVSSDASSWTASQTTITTNNTTDFIARDTSPQSQSPKRFIRLKITRN